MSTIPFFAFFILVFLGHYFAWKLILASSLKLQARKYLILSILVVISVSFLGSFAFLHSIDNSILAIFYVIFAILFGLLSQLMLFGFIFYCRLLLIKYWPWAKLHCIFPDSKTVARIFLILVAVFFLLGSYNAYFPRTKVIELNNFIGADKNISFVQLSDLHLGAVNRPYWLSRVAKKVNSVEPDFIIISGDLFDGTDLELDEFIEPLKSFKAPVIFVPGNHDSYLYQDEVYQTNEAAGIITLSDEAMIINDLEIIGFNFLSNEDSDIRREIKNIETEKGYPRIVVNHVPVDQAEALALGADLMLSGHAHRGQIFPFSLATTWLYGDYAYGLDLYENILTYTSAGTGTWGPPFRTLLPGEIILFRLK